MTRYREDDYLAISGVQHFAFCKRQWALIHIENQWLDNARTVDGQIFHERAHQTGFTEKRGSLLTVRGLVVSSSSLGVSGECDVVEFRRDDERGAVICGYPGRWQPVPVEYKSGKAKIDNADRLQLCLQAMCLEEMLACRIPDAYLFYGETRRREPVPLDDALRAETVAMVEEMHAYMRRGYTPKVSQGKHCWACSLRDICLPVLCESRRVSDYVHETLAEEDSL